MTEFKTSIKQLNQCDFCGSKDSEWSLEIPYDLHLRISEMSLAMGSTEWLGYFDIDKDEKDKVYVMKNLRVPLQEAGGAAVHVTVSEDAEGTIHSHHSMGAFTSNTDETSIGGNHNITVVFSTNNGGTYKGKEKKSMPCKGYVLQDLDVYTIDPPVPDDVLSWVEAAKGMVKPIVYTPQPWTGGMVGYDEFYDGYGYYGAYRDVAPTLLKDEKFSPEDLEAQPGFLNPISVVCCVCKKMIPSYEGVKTKNNCWRHADCGVKKIETPPYAGVMPERTLICASSTCRSPIKKGFEKIGKDGLIYHFGCCPDSWGKT